MPGTSTLVASPKITDVAMSTTRGVALIAVSFSDGRVIGLPLAHYPALERATAAQRRNWRLIGGGDGVHWPDLDLDLSASGFLAGTPDMTRAALQRLPLQAKVMLAMTKPKNGAGKLELATLIKSGMNKAQIQRLISQLGQTGSKTSSSTTPAAKPRPRTRRRVA